MWLSRVVTIIIKTGLINSKWVKKRERIKQAWQI